MRISPAEHVIKKFGGVRATARALGRTHGAVSKWRQPKSKRGTGGQIPNGCMGRIMELGRTNGMDITATDLVFGRIVNQRKKKR